VRVGHPVAVGQAELAVADVVEHPLEAPARERALSGVHERHLPGLGRGAVHIHRLGAEVERDVAGLEEVAGEVLLDQVALVAQADHELVDPVDRVELHHVPEHRAAPDLDHRLGLDGRLFGEAGAETTGENYDFHEGALRDR